MSAVLQVARDLKYRTHDTDFGALANELHGQPPQQPEATSDDDYGDWAEYSDSRD